MIWKDMLDKTNKGMNSFFRNDDEPEHNELLGSSICRCKECKEKRNKGVDVK